MKRDHLASVKARRLAKLAIDEAYRARVAEAGVIEGLRLLGAFLHGRAPRKPMRLREAC
jgi:hypothetical protein